MSKKLIIFAHHSEAKQTLERFHAKAQAGHFINIWTEGVIPSLYECEIGWIALCNTGLHNAQWAVSKYERFADEIWNLGFAGRLNGNLEIGNVLSIEKVDKYVPLKEKECDCGAPECIAATLPQFSLESTNPSRLISSDFPIHSHDHRNKLAEKWDLVDMEGYGIAFASHQLGKKCRMWKIISDFASPEGRARIQKNKETLSKLLADHIEKELLCQKTG